MLRRSLFGCLLILCLAVFVAATSETFHVHDGLQPGDVTCPSCVASVLAFLVPVVVALARAFDERPRTHGAALLVWPDARPAVRLAARGPPAR